MAETPLDDPKVKATFDSLAATAGITAAPTAGWKGVWEDLRDGGGSLGQGFFKGTADVLALPSDVLALSMSSLGINLGVEICKGSDENRAWLTKMGMLAKSEPTQTGALLAHTTGELLGGAGTLTAGAIGLSSLAPNRPIAPPPPRVGLGSAPRL